MVYDLWFMVCCLWFVVCGLWFMVYGLWLLVYGSGLMIFGFGLKGCTSCPSFPDSSDSIKTRSRWEGARGYRGTSLNRKRPLPKDPRRTLGIGQR